FDYEGYLNEDEDSTGETTDEIIDGEVIDEEVAEEAAPEEEAAEEAAPEEDVATGGQCSPCESDLDCAGEARCFLLEGESQAACHDSCESDADCSGEDAYCADITAGYNLRCISCL
ncbi:hypothetical protein KAI87_06865, partial [Myxococcota bacterium]|nr:hypothetical protein [Myxococcota bacterium]